LYYIQYAHVRAVSVAAKVAQALDQAMPSSLPENIATKSDICAYSDQEKIILKKVCSLKYLLPQLAENHQIHLLAHFAYELSHDFHAYYNQQRIIDASQPALTQHRLVMVNLVRTTLATTMFIMGVTPLNKM
jgi:arginyl-tRNA synthetase